MINTFCCFTENAMIDNKFNSIFMYENIAIWNNFAEYHTIFFKSC